MAKSIEVKSSGIGFSGLLAIVFITLKLLGKISWSWWWVTAPIWGFSAIALVIAIGALLVAGIAAVVLKILEG